MNTPFFIAIRYLFSKKSQNVINLISGISIFGITIATAAMIIVISAFNGVEGLVISLFNSFEPDLKIELVAGKTFPAAAMPVTITEDEELALYSKIIEETVIFKNYEQFAFGKIKGVEPAYLTMVNMPEKLMESNTGFDGLSMAKDGVNYGFAGYVIFQNLGGYIYDIPGEYESLTIYAPRRNKKIKRNSSDAFEIATIPIAGVFSFNNTINEKYVIIPITLAQQMLDYGDEISALELQYNDGVDLELKKTEIKNILGPNFSVKTAYEQNELIYKTSKSEKWMVIVLLGFIFFLGTFTMVASITMLILEKKQNIKTLYAFGATSEQLKRIFFYEGLLINFLGIIFGLTIGVLVLLLQLKFGLLKMTGGMVENFPVVIKLSDIFLILGITTVIGMITAYLPSRILINKTIK
ncbi:ABC transporter permease [Putridiphycobacter roseus]|nr:FtsX-like permease family protein [Putridiphycobacter roseus]